MQSVAPADPLSTARQGQEGFPFSSLSLGAPRVPFEAPFLLMDDPWYHPVFHHPAPRLASTRSVSSFMLAPAPQILRFGCADGRKFCIAGGPASTFAENKGLDSLDSFFVSQNRPRVFSASLASLSFFPPPPSVVF